LAGDAGRGAPVCLSKILGDLWARAGRAAEALNRWRESGLSVRRLSSRRDFPDASNGFRAQPEARWSARPVGAQHLARPLLNCDRSNQSSLGLVRFRELCSICSASSSSSSSSYSFASIKGGVLALGRKCARLPQSATDSSRRDLNLPRSPANLLRRNNKSPHHLLKLLQRLSSRLLRGQARRTPLFVLAWRRTLLRKPNSQLLFRRAKIMQSFNSRARRSLIQ